MKNCSYCGRENALEAVNCLECGTEFSDKVATSRGSEPFPSDTPARVAAKKKMFWGALWFSCGLLVTLLSYLAAVISPFGGTYIFAWGAILFGAIKFWQGFRGRNTQPGKAEAEDQGYEALDSATRLETEGRIQEALTAYQSIVQEYPDSGAAHDAKKSIESLQTKLG